MSKKFNALKLNEIDNVAVALENLKVGELLCIQNQNEEIVVGKSIPYGHKIATSVIPIDSKVIKYGECMGIATEDIPVGSHVHVSNVRGLTEEDKVATLSQKEELKIENI
jgi:altronate dehydratase small subunit